MADLTHSTPDVNIESAYRLFMDCLSDGGDVNAIIKTAYQIFRRPVLLTDEFYKLIFQYPDRKLGQDIWDTLYDTGTLPHDTIYKYQKAFLKDPAEIYDPFFADWGDVREFPRIFGEIYTPNKQILGHIAIFMMGSPLKENDLAIAKILCKTLQIRMSSRMHRQHSYANYLADLIDPSSPEQLKILSISSLQKIIRGNYCLMVTPIHNFSANTAYAAVAVNRISYAFQDIVSTIYDNCIVTLFGQMSSFYQNDKEKAFLGKVAEMLNQSYPSNGISNCFNNLEELYVYYPQAYYTAMLGKPGPVFYSDEASSAHTLLSLKSAPFRSFIHPVLFEIAEYDREHNTQYFETLKTYSLLMHEKEKAAGALGIHRNTLLYRLNRIQDLFSLPFEETSTALHLLNSFQLWTVRERVSENEY